MKFKRDTNLGVHAIQVINANTPEEAAKKFRKELNAAFSETYNNPEKLPSYLEGKEVDYIGEVWSDKMHFHDENGNEYDSSGKLIPYEENNNDDEIGGIKFIWGLKSYDDLTPGEASLHSMNDIDIYYDESEKLYHLGIEEIYVFEKEEYRIDYLNHLADEFEDYLLRNGYKREEINDLRLANVFGEYYPSGVVAGIASMQAPTLTELYRKYKLFVKAYTAIAQCE